MKGDTRNKKKDIWDKLKALSVVLSSVVIGAAALAVNTTYSERQNKRTVELQRAQHQLGKVQALAAFMPHLSDTPERRLVALFAITTLGYADLAVLLERSFLLGQPTVDQNATDTIMQTAPATIVWESMQRAQTKTTAEELGWVYLGDYSTAHKSWKKHYLNFDKFASPDSLQGEEFKVRPETGALNVRRGMPTDSAEFLAVIKVLQPGTNLRVLEIKRWLTTGYTWARVALAES